MVGTVLTAVPSLSVPVPSDTTMPGLTRRHVWAAPELTSHSFLVMTLPRLYLAPPGGDTRPERAKALEKTLDIDGTLGGNAATIELNSIRRVRLDLVRNAVQIDHSPSGGTERTDITFDKPETADTVFSKLWRRLGSEFTLRPYRPDTWELSCIPLLVMFAIALGTALASMGLNALSDIHGGTDWVTAGFLPGWRLVSIAGGAAVAIAHLWLYRRLTQPPERLELIRT